jgi:malonyl-CoA/methylmalonyl-CoA synthetase
MSNYLFSSLLPTERDPEQICLIAPDGRTFSYGDIDRISARYASALVSCGIGKGDRVAVQVEKSPEALFLYLGCIRSGATFLPLNTAYTFAEIDYFIGDAEPALIVGRPEQAEEMKEIARAHGNARVETLGADGSGTLSALADSQSGRWSDVACGPNDLAAILYTSGTTGRSKGAMLSHENLHSNAKALIQTWRYTNADVLIHALPIFHAHGLFVATNVTLMAGAKMIFLPKFEPREVLAWMLKATVMMGVPTFYTRLLGEEGLTRESDSAYSALRLRLRTALGRYASCVSEADRPCGPGALRHDGNQRAHLESYDGERVPGSVGFPLPGVEVRIVDQETGRELATEEVGMVEVRGPNVTSGYWRMPEKTRAEFRADGFFITGDLGKIDGRGYLWLLGRGKDLVITGGYNVYPKEVELEIDALPRVPESAVFGVPHPDFGEAVTAVVVPEKGARLREADIIDQLRLRLANYKLPKRIVIADDLPRNTMAKVQKNLLREQHKALFV